MTASAFTLRQARPDDTAFLRDLYASTREDERALVPWDDAEWRSFLDHQFDAQRAHYAAHFGDTDHRIVLVDGHLAGRWMVRQTPDEVLLVDLALLPEFRNRGIGTTLVQDALDVASRAGIPVRLQVLRTSRAIGLYQRLGFSIVGDTGAHLRMEWRPPRAARGVS